MTWKETIKTKNLEISIVNFSSLQGAVRLDSDYYEVKYLENERYLKTKNTSTILELTDFVKKGIFDISPEKYCSAGVPLIRVKDIKGGFLNYTDAVFLDEKDHVKEKKTELGLGDIVFSKVGTVGEVALVDKRVNFSQNVLGIKIRKDKINSNYLLCFLLSKSGYYQIKRAEMISVQPKLELKDIRDLLVPIPSISFQEDVSKVIISSIYARSKSFELYIEAKEILLKEIGLDKHTPIKEKVSVRDLFECLRDDRFDAEYWQPEYDAMEKAVSKVTQKELGEIVSMSKGVEVGSEAYDPEGMPFIRVSDFSIYGIDDVEKKISPELYEELKDKYMPKKGEVLFTKDGTIGLSYALHEDTIGILSGAFLRLKPTIKINTDYLALVLNSLYCKTQIVRMSGGAIIAHLKPESAKKIKIPLLSDAKQSEIADKVSTAFRMRKEAQELLSKAKHAVEVFIEKDEVEALKILK